MSETQKLGPQGAIVQIDNEGVHDSPADRRDEHGSFDSRFRPAFSPEEQATQTVHDISELFVLCENRNDKWVAQYGSHGATTVDREVDDAGDQGTPGSLRGGFALGISDDRIEARQFRLGSGHHDVVFRPELMVNGRFGHADLVGDHL